jgi:hypothetical protein
VPLDNAGDLHDPEQDPTEEVDRRQRRQAVHRAIRELPHRHRTAITYTLSGLSPEEVGKQMGIGRNAADALLHRARRSLKEHLSSVREGAWGIAFGVRMKWDRVTRRAPAEFIDVSRINLIQAGAGVAAAAIVAVFGIAGASSSGNAVTSGSRARDLKVSVEAPSVSEPGLSSAQESTPSVQDGGSSDRRGYTFGPASGSFGPGGSDTKVRVPDPANRSGPPIVDIAHRLYPREGGGGSVATSGPAIAARDLTCRATDACP